MKDYIFIDEDTLNMFYEQKCSRKSPKVKYTFGFELPVLLENIALKFNVSRENESRILNKYEKIDALRIFLKKEGLLTERRPFNRIQHNDLCFFEERFVARKIIIPADIVKKGLKVEENLVVWISEPNPDDLIEDEWDGHGSFLFLTEKVFDMHSSSRMESGCSALQALWNKVTGEDFFNKPNGEPFGRWNSDHPVDKLRKFGARVSDSRELVALYSKRYMTNEQAYIYNGKRYRTNDILGYPIFIAN